MYSASIPFNYLIARMQYVRTTCPHAYRWLNRALLSDQLIRLAVFPRKTISALAAHSLNVLKINTHKYKKIKATCAALDVFTTDFSLL